MHGCGIVCYAQSARLLSRGSGLVATHWASLHPEKLELDLSEYCEYNRIFNNNLGHDMIKIFDLDGTVIDSSHRTRFLADGSLDLAY